MNNKRRELLRNATDLLGKASNMVQSALYSEQDCLDNMPENLLDSERCQKMEDAIERLEEAVEQIDSAKDCINEASA